MQPRVLRALACFVSAAALMCGGAAQAAPPSEPSKPGTDVPGGALAKDTVWSLAGSPYRVHGTVQIPKGIALDIQPGVEVLGDDVDLFQVYGTVRAIGTGDLPVTIDGGGAGITFFDTDGGPDRSRVKVKHAVISNGGAFWISNREGSFYLKQSTVKNMCVRSEVVSPTRSVTIAQNVFQDSAGWLLSTTNATSAFHVHNNRFVGGSLYGPWIGAGYTYGQPLEVHRNTFSAGQLAVELEFSTGDIDARSNYWGTLDTDEIADMIIDGRDNPELEGIVAFKPILTEPDPDTPKITESEPSGC